MTQIILGYYHTVWCAENLQALSTIFSDEIIIDYHARDVDSSFVLNGKDAVIKMYQTWSGYADRLSTIILNFNMEQTADNIYKVSYRLRQRHYKQEFCFEVIDTIYIRNDQIQKIIAERISKSDF
jgi:hypothetical protein